MNSADVFNTLLFIMMLLPSSFVLFVVCRVSRLFEEKIKMIIVITAVVLFFFAIGFGIYVLFVSPKLNRYHDCICKDRNPVEYLIMEGDSSVSTTGYDTETMEISTLKNKSNF